MARSTFVKAARKAVPSAGINVGDSYYWWKFRFGGKHYSKTRPKASQLTQSAFYGELYNIQEDAETTPDFDDLESALDDIKSRLETLRDEQEEKRSNMPYSLQDSDTGNMLQERYDALDSAISDIDSLDVPNEADAQQEIEDAYVPLDEGDPDEWTELPEEKRTEQLNEIKQEKANEFWSEVTSAIGDISV